MKQRKNMYRNLSTMREFLTCLTTFVAGFVGYLALAVAMH
jgi:hypothetical protein